MLLVNLLVRVCLRDRVFSISLAVRESELGKKRKDEQIQLELVARRMCHLLLLTL